MGYKEIVTSNQPEELNISINLERANLHQFLRQSSDFYPKIEEKFRPFLKEIGIKFYGQTYRRPNLKPEPAEEGLEKFTFTSGETKEGLESASKIVIKKEKQTEEIKSVSLTFGKGANDFFLKIEFEKGKLKSLERKTLPNIILPVGGGGNQTQKIEINNDGQKELKMTLGFLAGDQFSFVYPYKTMSPVRIDFENFRISRPKLERVFGRIKEIKDIFLK